MKLLVCGGRNWSNYKQVKEIIVFIHDRFGPIAYIIEGGALGADQYAAQAGRELGIRVQEFPARWEEYKEKYPVAQYGMKWKSAGNDRNQQMLDEGKPDLVLAFHADIASSKGTWDMIKRANKAGVLVILIAK